MSNDQEQRIKLTTNTVLTAVGVVMMALIGWGGKTQLESLAKGQDNIRLAIEKEVGETYVTKAEHAKDISAITDWTKAIQTAQQAQITTAQQQSISIMHLTDLMEQQSVKSKP